MKKAWRFVRQWAWAILAAAGGLLFLVWRVMAMRSPVQTDQPGTPTVSDRAKVEVERIRLEGEVEKAKVTAVAEVHREEIARIEEVGKSDPKEARRQLASWLNDNL